MFRHEFPIRVIIPLLCILATSYVIGNSVQRTGKRSGSCLSSAADCTRRGGNSTGATCAAGFGVCCAFEATCGSVVRENNTYFVNPNDPEAYSVEGTCSVTLEKLSSEIVQIRLDLEEFSVNGVTDRLCLRDSFQVFGSDTHFPPLCGQNTGQHVYVDVGSVRGPITLLLTTSGDGARRWRIRISQLEKTNPSLAPTGCLQYYTGATGNVRSFNFDSPAETPPASRIIKDQNYAVCIRRETGYCSVMYRAGTGGFTLAAGTAGPNVVNTDGQCNTAADQLFIPGATFGPTGIIGSRFCGSATGSQVANFSSNASGLLRLIFTTTSEVPQGDLRGFSLDYQQNLCTSNNIQIG